jgi:two-component system sensor histidine kinase UhpB
MRDDGHDTGMIGAGERYRLLFENATDAIFYCDLEGTIVDANQAAERLTGFRRSELVGQNAAERLLPPEWHEVARTRLARRLAELTPHQLYESVFLDRAGQRLPVETSSTLVYQDGQLVGIASIVRDVGERKRSEAVLAESEERFRQAFEHAAIGMAVSGPGGRWLQVNHALCDMLGFTQEELLDRSFHELTHPDDLELDLAYLRRLFAGEIPSYRMEKRYLRKDGEVIRAQLTRSVVRNAEGIPLYAIAQVQPLARAAAGPVDERAARRLSAREREVLGLVADGLTSEQAAVRLGVSAETIQTHVRRAMRKLDARTRTQAVAAAIRVGIV